MTGRLDQVDLDTDLILIVLGRSDEPMFISELLGRIDPVDVDPFVFDEAFPGGSDEFIRGLRMFEKIGLIEKDEHRIQLTEKGELMTEHLEAALDPDEGEALEYAGVVR